MRYVCICSSLSECLKPRITTGYTPSMRYSFIHLFGVQTEGGAICGTLRYTYATHTHIPLLRLIQEH